MFQKILSHFLVISIVLPSVVLPSVGAAQAAQMSGSGSANAEAEAVSHIPPKPQPITIDDFIREFTAVSGKLISAPSLLESKRRIEAAVAYMGSPEEEKFRAAAIFKQWLYLDLFRQMRLQYLLVNLVKILPFIDMGGEQATLRAFDQLMPERFFATYPQLAERRAVLRKSLREMVRDRQQIKEAREFFLGVTESAYMSLAVIAAKRRFVEDRFASSDERYKSEMQKLRNWQSIVQHSSGLINTSAFKRNVEPYHEAETAKAVAANEVATSRYLNDLRKFIEKRRSISDLVTFLKSGSMIRFGRDLAANLSLPEQRRFRQRIADNFDSGVAEVYRNLSTTLEKFRADFADRDIAGQLITANTLTSRDSSEFHRWLIRVFREQPLHWIITEDYPYLQTAADDLTNFVNYELRSQQVAGFVRAIITLGVFSLAPMGYVGNRYSRWMTRTTFRALQVGVLGAKAYMIGDYGYQTYLQYQSWRQARRLSRLNLEGSGLQTLLQEDNAYWSMVLQGAMTGMIGLTAIANARNLRVNKYTREKSASPIRKAIDRTWAGKPIREDAFYRDIHRHVKKLRSGFLQVPLRQSGAYAQRIVTDVTALLSQWVVAYVASWPKFAKSFLTKLPGHIYQGITLGTVMSIMSVTVQTYITAWGLHSFVWTFEKLGFEPPAYWQQATLNLVDRTKRDGMTRIETELILSKGEIVKLAGLITQSQIFLRRDDITADERTALMATIESARESIRNHLRMQVIRWYLNFEYRTIANSVWKHHGYGLKVTPNIDEPYTMTAYIKIGGLPTFSYTTTAAEIERVRDRMTVPGNPETEEDRRKLADRLFARER